MANDAMWPLASSGGARAPAADADGRASDDAFDPLMLGYEAADPLLQARLWGETPVSWPASESRP